MTVALAWLFDTTIKGSLMILLVAALHRLIGNRVDARIRHLLWVVVLLRLVVPAVPSSSVSLFNLLPSRQPAPLMARVAVEVPAQPGQAAGFVETVTIGEPRSLVTARWIAGIWLLGVIALGLRTLIASIRMQRAVNRALRDRPGSIVECDFVKTPALHGMFRPVLLIPPGLTAEELRHVVLHEMGHLQRMDVAVSWLLSVAQTLHWFNPLVWFAASWIKEERELSCDELALSLLEEEERPRYGRTILELLERFRMTAPVPALVGIVNHKQKMKRRITMIATFTNRRRFTMLFLALVAAVGAMGLTDGKDGERMLMKRIDPAALATVEKLNELVSFEIDNGSINDLLNTVANKTGVAVVQSPELSTLAVQQARFTIKAENIPAHAVLMEALIPFELTAEPTAAGVAISDGSHLRHEDELIVSNGDREERTRVIRVLKGETPMHVADERIFVKRVAKDGATFDKNGKSHRELTIDIMRDGVKSEGKLTIDITK